MEIGSSRQLVLEIVRDYKILVNMLAVCISSERAHRISGHTYSMHACMNLTLSSGQLSSTNHFEHNNCRYILKVSASNCKSALLLASSDDGSC